MELEISKCYSSYSFPTIKATRYQDIVHHGIQGIRGIQVYLSLILVIGQALNIFVAH